MMALEHEQTIHPSEARRQYNREYMRRWRSDPQNLERERVNRQHSHYLRKVREATSDRPLCGFCHQRPPVCRVRRLDVVQGRRGGFVAVSVPYCGRC